MKPKNKLNIIFHLKYSYTAIVIAIIWTGMLFIILNQKDSQCELLIGATSLTTLIIALIGFKTSN